jgi:mRNA-degrading endonuclease RelE of RelBE toxin-antitoxin system
VAKVEFTDQALEDLNGFDNSSRQTILLGLRKLEIEPQKRGSILSGNLHPLCRLVVGKKRIRILYSVTPDSETSEIFVIADRRDDEVYKIAAERLAKLEE